MANALTLEAPPWVFDELASILLACDCSVTLVATDSEVHGVRRQDTACYAIKKGCATVELWAERRVGNPSIFISLISTQRSIWRRAPSSDQLAKQIAGLLVEHGAKVD